MSKQSMLYEDMPMIAECNMCSGSGEVVFNKSFSQDPINDERLDCLECKGTGIIQCLDPGNADKCRFNYCYCEAAWDRQQEDLIA